MARTVTATVTVTVTQTDDEAAAYREFYGADLGTETVAGLAVRGVRDFLEDERYGTAS